MRYGRALVVVAATVIAVVLMVWLRDGWFSRWWGIREQSAEIASKGRGTGAESGVLPETPARDDHRKPSGGRTYRSLGTFKVNPFAQGGRFLITGQVFSQEEQPVAAAHVALYGRRDERTSQFAQLLATGGTNIHGRYEIKIDFPLEGWIAVHKPGYAQVEGAIRLDEPGIVSRNFTLPKALGRIRGKVVDGLNGLPISNAEVFLSLGPIISPTAGAPPRGISRDFLVLSGRSEVSAKYSRSSPSGEFVFDELPEGQVTLTAAHTGCFEDIKTVSMSGGTTEDVELRIVRGESVSFLVKNKRGEPIACANVRRPDYLIGKTDDYGKVEIPLHLNPKSFRIKVWADGYLASELSLDPRLPPREITLEEGPLFSGTVISEWGDSIKGAQISIYSAEERNGRWEKMIRTDEAGRFETRISHPPVQRIDVSSSGYIAELITIEDDEIPVNLRIVLEAGEGAIAGRVIDFSGRPIRQFSVDLHESDAPKARSFSKVFDNPDGSFTLADLPQGRFSFNVTAGNTDKLASTMIGGLEIRKGMVLDLGTIQLEEPKAPFKVPPRRAIPNNLTRREINIPIAAGDRIQ